MKKYHLFISYSRKDDTTYKKDTNEKSDVDIILESLKKENFIVWIDRDEEYPGNTFQKEIIKAIKDSELMLFISSVNSNDDDSYWVFREVNTAADLRMQIIPLLLDPTPFNDEIGMVFSGKDRIEWFKNKKKSLTSLINKIKKHIQETKEYDEKIAREKEAEAARLAAEKEKKKKEDLEKKRVEKLKDEIARLQKQVLGTIEKQQSYLDKWTQKRKELSGDFDEITTCPVCESKYDEKTDHCELCGWYFGLPEDILSEELQQQYDDRLATSSIVWERKKGADNELKTLKEEHCALKTYHEQLQKRLEQAEASAKTKAEEGKKALLAKQEQIARLEKSLNDTKAQLVVAQKSIDNLKSKAKQAKASRTPIAFLLVTEFNQSDVYLLYEGRNVFGALGPQAQSPEYQMIVATEKKLKPQHFEILIDKRDKHFQFRVRPISSTCSLAYNSTTNIIDTELPIHIGDILYIGGMKINIIDNFNK